MPQTIITSSTEYEAATDAEVADLIAAFEAAQAAYDQVLADLGEQPPYAARERYDAYQAAKAPYAHALAQANKALSRSRNLPVGTAVSFVTSAGWADTEHDSGVIVRVTDSSYVVRKEYLGGEARLPREHAHEYKSSYGGGKGRSLSVLRTPRQQAAYAEQQAQARAQEKARREAQQARYAAEEARRVALRSQEALGQTAKRRALDILLRRHAEEFAILEKDALDILALAPDVPGRAETAPLPEPETT